MPTYLYCLVDPDAELVLDDLAGIDGGAVRLLRAPTMTALVGDVGEGGVAPTAEHARAHDAVVRRAMTVTTPLPARFGQLFPDDAGAAASILGRAPRLERALALVRGCVEMTVRVRLDEAERGDEPDMTPAVETIGVGPGRHYLLELQNRQKVEQDMLLSSQIWQSKLSELVGGEVLLERLGPGSNESRTAVFSHLIRRESAEKYRQALRGANVGGLMVSGPWAPYSFAGDADVE